MTIQLVTPEKIINTVITHQFESAFEAMSKNNSVEIGGFGKFVFKEKRAKYELEKFLSQEKMYKELLETDLSATLRRNTELRLATAQKNIKDLKPRIT